MWDSWVLGTHAKQIVSPEVIDQIFQKIAREWNRKQNENTGPLRICYLIIHNSYYFIMRIILLYLLIPCFLDSYGNIWHHGFVWDLIFSWTKVTLTRKLEFEDVIGAYIYIDLTLLPWPIGLLHSYIVLTPRTFQTTAHFLYFTGEKWPNIESGRI